MSGWRDLGTSVTPRDQTGGLARWQEDGQRFDRIQPRRVNVVQSFQKGIEAVGDFGQLRVQDFQSHRVAQTPHLLLGQFLHTSLPWLGGSLRVLRLVQLGGSMYPLFSTGSRGKTTRSPAPNWRGNCGAQH